VHSEYNCIWKLIYVNIFTGHDNNCDNDAKQKFMESHNKTRMWWFHPDEAPMWQLEVTDLLKLKVWNHEGNVYIIHSHTLMIYDIKGESICRWGESNHATEGHEFPDDLKPTCQECSSTEITWDNNPYTEEIYGKIVYGWWCEKCFIQNCNEI
jgi:hypothetical protein